MVILVAVLVHSAEPVGLYSPSALPLQPTPLEDIVEEEEEEEEEVVDRDTLIEQYKVGRQAVTTGNCLSQVVCVCVCITSALLYDLLSAILRMPWLRRRGCRL